MLKMQTAVKEDIKQLRRELRVQDKATLFALADKQDHVITEMTKIIVILENDGTAVAFPELFELLRGEAKQVRRRSGRPAHFNTIQERATVSVPCALF